MKPVVVFTGPAIRAMQKEVADTLRQCIPSDIEGHLCATSTEVETSLRPYGPARLRGSIAYFLPHHPEGMPGVQKWSYKFTQILKGEVASRCIKTIPGVTAVEHFPGVNVRCSWDSVTADTLIQYAKALDAAFQSADWRECQVAASQSQSQNRPQEEKAVETRSVPILQECVQCRQQFDARMFSCPRCGSGDGSVLAGGTEVMGIMTNKQRAVELGDRAAELFQSGKLDEAIAMTRDALRINPMYEQAHSNLGFALIEKGDYEEAVRIFEHVLSFSPNRDEAKRGLATAQGKMAQASLSESPRSSPQASMPPTKSKWWQFWK